MSPQVDPQYALMQRLDLHLDESLERVERGGRPIWESQLEIGKTLVTVAAGSLVLSITWLQFLVSRVPAPTWSPLISVAWSLFATTILLAASRQGWLGRAQAGRLAFEQLRGDLRLEVSAIDRAGGGSAEIDEAIARAVARASEEPTRALTIYNRISIAMFWCFAVGIVSLVVFALRNLPF